MRDRKIFFDVDSNTTRKHLVDSFQTPWFVLFETRRAYIALRVRPLDDLGVAACIAKGDKKISRKNQPENLLIDTGSIAAAFS